MGRVKGQARVGVAQRGSRSLWRALSRRTEGPGSRQSFALERTEPGLQAGRGSLGSEAPGGMTGQGQKKCLRMLGRDETIRVNWGLSAGVSGQAEEAIVT